ncbi:helix-turn-helix domain-containing protein [Amycolatopsis sp. lyj-23]|uniref:helix-turn-helix domain-containing protein n=1 Tax=Amycolatopsis sp. lyj-23 TaxID=2789283 RepID=UPI00397D1A48
MRPRPAADAVDLDGAAQLLGVSARKVRRLVKRGRFAPATVEADDGARLWDARELWHWATRNDPARAASMPLKHWVIQDEPPELSVVRTVRDAVVQDWYLADDPALLRVVWPTGDFMSSDAGGAARLDPPVPWVLQVGPGSGCSARSWCSTRR